MRVGASQEVWEPGFCQDLWLSGTGGVRIMSGPVADGSRLGVVVEIGTPARSCGVRKFKVLAACLGAWPVAAAC